MGVTYCIKGKNGNPIKIHDDFCSIREVNGKLTVISDDGYIPPVCKPLLKHQLENEIPHNVLREYILDNGLAGSRIPII